VIWRHLVYLVNKGNLLLHGMKLQNLKTSSHVELQKLAGDCMDLRPT
jgi:hypothetical protein